MKHVERSHSWPIPGTNSLVRSLALLFLALLLASCGNGGGSNPEQPITPLGSDASLSSLSVGGQEMQPEFSSSDTVYFVWPSELTTDVVVSATAGDDGASLRFVAGTTQLTSVGQVTANVPLSAGENRIDLYVTAEDGITTQTYTISYILPILRHDLPEPPEPAPGSDASLSSLWAVLDRSNGLTPFFWPYLTVYRKVVDNGTTDVLVSATATDLSASVTIIGPMSRLTSIGDATTSIPITIGQTRVDILVTAKDGTTTRTYTLALIRNPSRNAYLGDLEISGATLNLPFSYHRFNYTAVVPSGTTSLNVNATLQDELANMTISGVTGTSAPLAFGENTIAIEVTAEDGTTTNTYTIVVTRLTANNANLSDLILSVVSTWDLPFETEQSEYTLTVGAFSRNLLLTPTAEDTDAQITVNGAVVVSGSASAPITLAEGANLITINVTSADGTAARTYTLAVNRQSALPVSQMAYVKASNSDGYDVFGGRVALSADGTTLVVGATGEGSYALGVNGDEQNNSEPGSGAVYVFAREDDGTWAQQVYIKASQRDGIPGDLPIADLFGSSVALSSDGATLAASAPMEGGIRIGDTLPLDDPTGMVDLYTRDAAAAWRGGESFRPMTYPQEADRFGTNIALSGDGKTLAASNSGYPDGAVVIYADDGSGWMKQAYIERPVPSQQCGYSECRAARLALSDNGATLAMGGNVIHLFAREGSVWAERATIARYSSGLSLSGDGRTLAVARSSSIYLYVYDGGGWTEQTYIRASDSDGFSWVALSEDGVILAVGVSGEDSAATGVDGDETDNTATNSGGVYLFTRDSNDRWVTRTYVKASNTDPEDFFGTSVALSADGTTLVVGATGEDSAATGIGGDEADNSSVYSGAVYIFELDSTP